MARQIAEDLGSQIRAAVAALTAGPQRRYPAELQARIARDARERMRAGVPRAKMVKEIGVSDPTLSRLLGSRSRGQRGGAPFRRVSVADRQASVGTPLVVRAPGGIIIEGLDAAGVAALIRALS